MAAIQVVVHRRQRLIVRRITYPFVDRQNEQLSLGGCERRRPGERSIHLTVGAQHDGQLRSLPVKPRRGRQLAHGHRVEEFQIHRAPVGLCVDDD